MSTISIITPWQDHPEHIADYERSVRGAQVIIVDNASRLENAAELQRLVDRLSGVYVRNETNACFSAANNQGLEHATGDIVLFLNNDITAAADFLQAVERDVVADNALMGPAVSGQNVYCLWLPYLEGWCLAGRQAAWQRLGGWDANAYAKPYWEDIDLCFRAMQADIKLVHCPWPIQHKGGQLRADRVRWGLAYEHNRATFAARVRPHYERLCAEQGIVPDSPF